ncbi:uncharacterized protein LOC120277784 [Dioscorea cayenensis subsp. rotundata]|uniref:Uncharacterized protein LOC120277784 n=1 Tax=Dioscorea cayennensis subsp. rotundata TaxID=55577 RepID=A0AB40CMH8_DIOCR|nr:uncharacterized protein LOC120277784 [Dioscorea cayenensis subsp. rotundata]
MLNTYYFDLLGFNDEDIDVMLIVSRIRTLCNELCETFSSTSTHDEEAEPPLPPSSSKFTKWGNKILERRKRPRTSGTYSELEVYLTTVFEFGDDTGPNFSILEWWSRHTETFPTLAKIAKQLLAVPASTVAVEQTFSNGGNILHERRSRLGPESLEAQTCLDDWERARLRSQEDLIHSSSSDEWVNDGSGTTTAASSSNSSDDDASN